MLTAREGILLSNGVFLQDGDFVKVIYVDNTIIEGQIEYFTKDGGMVIETPIDYWDITFSNNRIKDIQLAQ